MSDFCFLVIKDVFFLCPEFIRLFLLGIYLLFIIGFNLGLSVHLCFVFVFVYMFVFLYTLLIRYIYYWYLYVCMYMHMYIYPLLVLNKCISGTVCICVCMYVYWCVIDMSMYKLYVLSFFCINNILVFIYNTLVFIFARCADNIKNFNYGILLKRLST